MGNSRGSFRLFTLDSFPSNFTHTYFGHYYNFHFGLKNWKKTLLPILFLCSASLLVGVWPYLNNWAIFGSPISDNPAVFAMPELRWNEYFSYARGLNSWAAKIQYGV